MSFADRFRLDGRVAVVTGASSGIGAHLARTLADAGATVVLAARRRDRIDALAAELPSAAAIECDVADADQCQSLIAETVEQFGRVDILVNNAGIGDPVPAEEESLDLWRQVMAVNLDAVFALSTEAGRVMLDGDGGSIVNIASVHGLVASAPNNQAGYVASKGAVVQLTKELACQWARRGVRVNAIAPGYFDTELTQEMIADDRGRAWIERNTPMRRSGELAELDGALLLLASDAGSYITGTTVAVDGGWTAR